MNIIITGASSGIGFETAIALCRLKHNVVAVSRNARGLEELESKLRSLGFGQHLCIIQADITREDELQQLKFRVQELHDRIDVLINNAGVLLKKKFEEIRMEELRAVYDTNLFSAFRLIQLLLPLMGGNHFSHIVNIGSMGGVQGSVKFPGLSAYSSSKGALAGLTEILAVELEPRNIHVNCLALGAVRTKMLENAFPDYQGGRSSAEIGHWLADFATSSGRFFNGKIIPLSDSTP